MKRKVSKVGPATLMITLPSKWCKENSIKQGEELDVEIDENRNLIVERNKREKKVKEISIDLNKFRYFPRHLIAAAYKN